MISEMVAIAISFATTLIITPQAGRFLHAAGIVGLDLHKRDRPRLPSSGGVCVAFGVLAGLLTYVGIKTFVYGLGVAAIPLLAAISTVLIVTFVGLFDDMNVSTRRIKTKDGRDIRVGLPQWLKPLLTLPAAVPLMVISAGETSMAFPLIGSVDLGILYPLVLIPLGVVACSNLVNLLGGFNGSEAGMGLVYMSSLGLYALSHQSAGAVIFLVSAASLLAFIKYNWVPARILPGDSLTYLLGSTVAAGVIIGNMEKVGMVIMLPFVIEFLLKLRSRFRASCLGRLRADGRLDPPYEKKIYSWTHGIMNLAALTERQVTVALMLIQVPFAAIPFLNII
jgi:UDP-N-acetylglucosamine--dolichyl-phosphate N-acetylglucosaminephosphotransferase